MVHKSVLLTIQRGRFPFLQATMPKEMRFEDRENSHCSQRVRIKEERSPANPGYYEGLFFSGLRVLGRQEPACKKRAWALDLCRHPMQQVGAATFSRDKNGDQKKRGTRKPTQASEFSQKSAHAVNCWLRIRLPSILEFSGHK